jgi:ATP sulfurylase
MQNHLRIKVEKVLGSYFCKKCDNVVIKNSCSHKSLINISGTEFRNCLKDKRYFKYADYNLQNFIFGIKEKIFVD